MPVFRTIPKGDLSLTAPAGQPQGTTWIQKGAGFAVQRVTVTLDVFLGEYFLDQRIGIPYFRDVLIHKPNAATVQGVFEKAILNTPGIVQIDNLTVALDTKKRRGSLNFTAHFDDGSSDAQAIDLII